MPDRARIVRELIAEAIAEVNLQLPPEQHLALEDEEKIIAPGSKLDSLRLVHFLIGLEGSLESRLGHPVPLTTDDILAQTPSPLATLGDLVRHACEHDGS